MDAAIKDAWVEDLRSGKYKQGRKQLHNAQDEFCCLGVLCEIAVKNGVIPEPVLDHDAYRYAQDRTAVLPNEVQEWAGLENSLPFEPVPLPYDEELYMDLASLNDGGMSFKQIADVINYFF